MLKMYIFREKTNYCKFTLLTLDAKLTVFKRDHFHDVSSVINLLKKIFFSYMYKDIKKFYKYCTLNTLCFPKKLFIFENI